MPGEKLPQKVEAAAHEFDRAEGRGDGRQIAWDLRRSLVAIGDALYSRLHEDVERVTGLDSMLMPVSELKTRSATMRETDCYMVAESAAAVEKAGYIKGPVSWYLRWLAALQLDDVAPACQERIEDYSRRSADARRLALSDTLLRIIPESSRTPLVLFRLLPLAVQLATALAFHDSSGADQARQAQCIELPAIGDCRSCQGAALAIGQTCPQCGNPLWKYELLVSGA